MRVIHKRLLNSLAVVSVAAYFIEVSSGLVGHFAFLTLERIIASIFTYELIVQLRKEDRYWKTGEFIVDVLSILPFWIGFFVPAENLDLIRTLRVLRLTKLFWHNDSFIVIKDTFRLAWPSIRSVGFVLICTALFAAAILFQVEKETFGTIGNTLYFVMTTITTVGFGDFSPKTPLGKFITIALLYGPALMICGTMIGVACSAYQTSLERFKSSKIDYDDHI